MSPDRSQFAFASWKGVLGGNANQNVFDLVLVSDKKEPRVIAPNIIRRAREFAASWSPDGEWLSYVTTENHSEGECYIVSLSGGIPRKATMDKHPAFNEWTGAALSGILRGATCTCSLPLTQYGRSPWPRERPARSLGYRHGKIYSIVAPMNESQFWSLDGGRAMVVSFTDIATKQSGFCRIDLATGAATELLREEKFYENFQPSNRILD